MPKGKPVAVTDELRASVAKLAGAGLTQDQAADVLGISERTIRNHFSDDWKRGTARAIAAVATRLYQKAMSGDTACLIFWLKSRAQWSESAHRVEVTGKDGAVLMPPAHGTMLVPVATTAEEWEREVRERQRQLQEAQSKH